MFFFLKWPEKKLILSFDTISVFSLEDLIFLINAFITSFSAWFYGLLVRKMVRQLSANGTLPSIADGVKTGNSLSHRSSDPTL